MMSKVSLRPVLYGTAVLLALVVLTRPDGTLPAFSDKAAPRVVSPRITTPVNGGSYVFGEPITFHAVDAAGECQPDPYAIVWHLRPVGGGAWELYQFTSERMLGATSQNRLLPLPGEYEVKAEMCAVESPIISFKVDDSPPIVGQIHPMYGDDPELCWIDWNDEDGDFNHRIQFWILEEKARYLRLQANDDATLYVHGLAVLGQALPEDGSTADFPNASTTYADQRYAWNENHAPLSSIFPVGDPSGKLFEIEWVNRGDSRGNSDWKCGAENDRYLLTLEWSSEPVNTSFTLLEADQVQIVSAQFWPNQGSGHPGFDPPVDWDDYAAPITRGALAGDGRDLEHAAGLHRGQQRHRCGHEPDVLQLGRDQPGADVGQRGN